MVNLITGSRHSQVPSHCFYADDIMIYCKAKIESMQALKLLFIRYANSASQIISASKSTIFSGGISESRLHNIINLFGFSIGSLPFTYLGAPIFKGRPKPIYFQAIADRVKSKLANWKASLLSIAGRVQLVKSVIASMLTHTMSVYSWPISLLKSMEKCIKNFIWTGDTAKRKLVTVAWKKVCNSYEGGGLGIRSLVRLNEAFNLKLGWDMLHSNEEWANILRSRAIKRRKPINHHIFSSLWNGIKHELPVITENSTWLIGNGKNVNFWYDNWCGDSLQNTFNLSDTEANNYPQSVSNFITNSHWNIPHNITIRFPALNVHVRKITLPLEDKDDLLIWKHSTSGTLSLKEAYQFKKPQTATLNWASKIWCKDIPPLKSLLVWRLMHDKVPTDEKLMERGCSIPSMCSLCSIHTETTFHLFF